MKINADIISSLDPCTSRFNNYLEHYKYFDGSIKEFLTLDKITYSDKVWVMVRMISTAQNVKWAALCAQSVLHIFESKFPDDKRPRKAIELVLSGETDRMKLDAARAAAYTAAAAAADAARAAAAAADAARAAAYTAAAYTAACAAAYTAACAAAYTAADAAKLAAYTAACAAAYTATAADAAYAAAAAAEQQSVNLKLLLRVIEEV